MVEAVFNSAFGFPSEDYPNRSWSLNGLRRVYSANKLSDVVPLVSAAEAEARAGAWVAVMMSYEAAPAFDTALRTCSPGDFPFAWAAVFSEIVPLSNNDFHCASERRTWTANISECEYTNNVRKIQELIADGETYQVNYTFPLFSTFDGNHPLSLYRQLCSAQGAKYCAYIDLGRYKVLSLSPELFFCREGQLITTRPMKGTIGRGRWEVEDNQMAHQLADSAKDRAENVMIVDLLRNDLGKVSIPGSVKVSRLFEIERYETLWQMTSTVEATLQPEIDLPQLMTAMFPCGSVTGAPKVRTMEIIRELESSPRGPYTGAIGLLRPGGDCLFNVAIRTLLFDSDSKKLTFGVGSGITFDSTAQREYDECALKARFLEYSAPSFDLLESILLEGGAFFLLDRHLSRLRSSARYFGFQCADNEVSSALNRVAHSYASGAWKIRLLLSKEGNVRTEVLRIEPVNDRILKVALATEPIDSGERFLFHKTTNRTLYEVALKARPDCDDVIFWNKRGEITESSIANVVLTLNGQQLTPSQNSGLLAGTFRQQLLAEGKIQERTIHKEDLAVKKDLFLINSLRKWMPATLID